MRRSISNLSNHHRGFTLVELLVVLGIVSLVVGITVPFVGGIGRSGNMESSINTISAALNVTRAIAIREGRETALLFSTGEGDQPVQIRIVMKNADHYSGGTAGHRNNWGFSNFDDRAPDSLGLGIGVAAPNFSLASPVWTEPALRQNPSTSNNWGADSNSTVFPDANRWLGVRFGVDGSVLTVGPSESNYVYFFDRDGNTDITYGTGVNAKTGEIPILWVPMLAIFDKRDSDKRPVGMSLNTWLNQLTSSSDSMQGKPRNLSFNRYSGMLQKR